MFRANQADNLTRGLPSERLGCKLLTLLDMRTGSSCIVRKSVLLTLVWLGFAAPASAQIYSWRDANGHLVLSNQRPDSEVRTYAVPQADSVRATRSVTASRDLMYDDLIVEQPEVVIDNRWRHRPHALIEDEHVLTGFEVGGVAEQALVLLIGV